MQTRDEASSSSSSTVRVSNTAAHADCVGEPERLVKPSLGLVLIDFRSVQSDTWSDRAPVAPMWPMAFGKGGRYGASKGWHVPPRQGAPQHK
jgi:hypothetical protein